MWIKTIGLMAVLFSSYVMGLYLSKLCSFRIQDLEQMKKAASIFQAELLYSASPLWEVFEQISMRTVGPVSNMFKKASVDFERRNGVSAEEIWTNSVEAEKEGAYFTPEDIENLFSFGRTLGFADKAQQAGNASLLISYIESAQEEAREKRKKDEKLYKTLGILGGVMVCVILF